MKIEDRFITYIKIDTKSSEESTETPSTAIQFNLARKLKEELEAMGASDVCLTDQCLVYATIPGDESKPAIGLISHMDTSPELDGGNFEPVRINHYDGSAIQLCKDYILSPEQFPSLKGNIGDDLLVTDGYHLLGGDDKAGIAIIMSVAEYYLTHPEIRHAPIKICFTPDEEVGRGPENFSVEKMNAKIAYTLDGGKYNIISYENFNAFSAHLKIEGVGIHPGSAKGIMVNSILVANEFLSMLPEDQIPQKTEGREGFIHACGIQGSVEETDIAFIIRDHDYQLACGKIKLMEDAAAFLQKKYPTAKITFTSKFSYRNMRDYFDKDRTAIDYIEKAFAKFNIVPEAEPIRGGTDGATITYMGLPCPNIGTGDYNCHGRYEYVDINEMYKMEEVVKALLEL